MLKNDAYSHTCVLYHCVFTCQAPNRTPSIPRRKVQSNIVAVYYGPMLACTRTLISLCCSGAGVLTLSTSHAQLLTDQKPVPHYPWGIAKRITQTSVTWLMHGCMYVTHALSLSWTVYLSTLFMTRDISSASERAFTFFFGRFFCCWPPTKKRGVLIHKNSLASCQLVSSQQQVTRPDMSSQTKSSERLVTDELTPHTWVNTPHIRTSEWDSLFFQSCLLSIVTVTPSDSDYVNKSACIQQFWFIHTTPSRRSRVQFFVSVPRGACAPGSRRTKSLETVATRVVRVIKATSIKSHCIVLFCERYWLAGVWCLCYVWWHTLFLINCFGIELVLCDF